MSDQLYDNNLLTKYLLGGLSEAQVEEFDELIRFTVRNYAIMQKHGRSKCAMRPYSVRASALFETNHNAHSLKGNGITSNL